jgi:2-succinyl-6-hydroxy-2,4-cyclohexadiene-1-carboxylate synthase
MMLALHGFTGGGGDFAPLAEAMPEFVWHTPDLPGHAPDLSAPGAPTDDCDLDSSVRYLDGLMAAEPAGPKILLGYSLGGRLALRYALARPQYFAALVLVGTSPGPSDARERATRRNEEKKLVRKIFAKGVPAFLEEWQSRPLIATQQRLPDAWRAAMQQRRRRLRAEGLAKSLWCFGQGTLEPVWERLPELRLTVLLCAGEEDKKYVAIAAEMKNRQPNFETLIVPGAGHLAHLENRDAFAAGLREFLRKYGLPS